MSQMTMFDHVTLKINILLIFLWFFIDIDKCPGVTQNHTMINFVKPCNINARMDVKMFHVNRCDHVTPKIYLALIFLFLTDPV